MTDSRETMRRRAFRDRRPRKPAAAPPAPAVVLRELCIIEHPDGPCVRPRRPGSQLCALCDQETDRLAAERTAAGWPS